LSEVFNLKGDEYGLRRVEAYRAAFLENRRTDAPPLLAEMRDFSAASNARRSDLLVMQHSN